MGILLLIVGWLLIISFAIWNFIKVWESGFHWVLIYHLVPFGAVVWCATHIREAWRPVLGQLAGLIVLVVGMFVGGRDPFGRPLIPDREEMEIAASQHTEEGDAVLDDSEGEMSAETAVFEADGEQVEAELAAVVDPQLPAQSAPTSGAAPVPDSYGGPPSPAPVAAPVSIATVSAPVALPQDMTYIDGVPVDTLWMQYYKAVERINAGDPQGIRDFEICLSSYDAHWLRQNMPILAEMVVPGMLESNPVQAQLSVVQALMRNMPTLPLEGKPEVKMQRAIAVARLTTSGESGPQTWTTPLMQESGRWVLLYPFYARNVVWNPQIAQYKRARGIQLSPEEHQYLAQGFSPFQHQIQALYTLVGFRP